MYINVQDLLSFIKKTYFSKWKASKNNSAMFMILECFDKQIVDILFYTRTCSFHENMGERKLIKPIDI